MNNLMALSFEVQEVKRRNTFRKLRAMSTASSVGMTVRGGHITDGFYRDASEKAVKGGRQQHLGIDVSVGKPGDGSYNDPRRGQPVYIAINPTIKLSDLNTVRAFNKKSEKKLDGLGIAGTGDAELTGGIIKLQPWSSTDDHAYGGVVGVNCFYEYNKSGGGKGEFMLYVEYLHLITERFLAKNAAGKIATLDEWKATGKPYGFGDGLANGQRWDRVSFLGPVYATAGYLGATQTPHVHIQCAFEHGKSTGSPNNVRVDPEIAIY
jgi:hypothetical protein